MEEVLMSREEHIIWLRDKGLTNRQIAGALNLSVSSIEQMAKKLIGAGKIGSRASTCFWKNLNNSKTIRIIEMVKGHASSGTIAKKLRCSKSRICKIISAMKKFHGAQIFSFDQRTWTPKAAAAELEVEKSLVYRLCRREGVIPMLPRGDKYSGTFLLTDEGMDALRKHPDITGQRICDVCKNQFVRKGGKGNVCPKKKCRRQLARQHRANCLARKADSGSVRGWHQALFEMLRTHNTPQNERWVTLTEAMEISGLKKHQLRWMAARKIIAIKPHPHRKQKGVPVKTYAESQLMIICEIRKQKKAA